MVRCGLVWCESPFIFMVRSRGSVVEVVVVVVGGLGCCCCATGWLGLGWDGKGYEIWDMGYGMDD